MFGFVVLSHKAPAQLLRLTRALNALYGDPPIACHHDFSQCALDASAFPPNVRFVEPSITTGWGNFPVVKAALSALRLLYAFADPDFFFILSAADYPTAGSDRVREDLLGSDVDAFIDAFPVEGAPGAAATIGDAHLAHHRTPYNLALARARYVQAQVRIPIVRFRPPLHSTAVGRYPRLGRDTKALPFDAPFRPFDRTYECYVGSLWFTANRKAAKKLLHPSDKDRRLQRYYRNRIIVDETYFQTVLCNDADLRTSSRTFRYAVWSVAHPINLGEEHLETILAAKAHFSRKFQPDDPVLDLIDRHLGIDTSLKSG